MYSISTLLAPPDTIINLFPVCDWTALKINLSNPVTCKVCVAKESLRHLEYMQIIERRRLRDNTSHFNHTSQTLFLCIKSSPFVLHYGFVYILHTSKNKSHLTFQTSGGICYMSKGGQQGVDSRGIFVTLTPCRSIKCENQISLFVCCRNANSNKLFPTIFEYKSH